MNSNYVAEIQSTCIPNEQLNLLPGHCVVNIVYPDTSCSSGQHVNAALQLLDLSLSPPVEHMAQTIRISPSSCSLHLPPAVPETCCAHFFLQISFHVFFDRPLFLWPLFYLLILLTYCCYWTTPCKWNRCLLLFVNRDRSKRSKISASKPDLTTPILPPVQPHVSIVPSFYEYFLNSLDD